MGSIKPISYLDQVGLVPGEFVVKLEGFQLGCIQTIYCLGHAGLKPREFVV